MEQKTIFRKLGFIYAVFCFLGSTFGVIVFFKQLVDHESVCSEIFCGGNEFMIVTSIHMLVFILSAIVSVFLKLGIDEAELSYINIHKAFMLTRNLVLVARWSVESATIKIAQIRENNSPDLEDYLTKVTLLLLSVSVIFGVEMWITNGIQRYTLQKLQSSFCHLALLPPLANWLQKSGGKKLICRIILA
ncbi:uncharacterized protein LOC128736208 [Sabethes cyaneus]|uniref:uncharacterized protein LOC128736208 n=1 Tax=Sabethes cyaneus TaxID=53552 RepID=UPI00237D859E|nr:uncharacterized protein LOC128736208 [Sabethes cyaneus]